MRFVISALLAAHGAIHVLGFLKAYGLAELPELQLKIGPRAGLFWLLAAGLLLLAAVSIHVTPRFWSIPALVGIGLSQAMIFGAWDDARVGTVANVILLVPVVLAAADLRPSSLRSTYAREVDAALSHVPEETNPVTPADLAGLPEPVRAYLERVGVVGRPRVTSFAATFRARIRGGPEDGWMEGTAEQHETFDPPTRIFFMTASKVGLPVHVLHRYGDGSATMEGRLLGIFPVFEISGPKLTRSETVTLLNDVFFLAPAALVDLPVEWQALDERRVRATYTNAGHRVSAVVHFDDDGDLVDFQSEDRYQMDRDPPVLERWSTPFYEPRDYGGYRLPSGGEARWGDPGEEWAYGDFELVEIRYGVRTPASW